MIASADRVLTPKVIVDGVAYDAWPASKSGNCNGCAGRSPQAPTGLCSTLPCFSDSSPLGARTIYKKVAQ